MCIHTAGGEETKGDSKVIQTFFKSERAVMHKGLSQWVTISLLVSVRMIQRMSKKLVLLKQQF